MVVLLVEVVVVDVDSFLVRISLGYLTSFNDIMTFVDFAKEYIDA